MTPKRDICPHFNASLLRHYRKKKYKTRKGFAKVLGVSRQAVDAWETGKSKPTWKHLIKMAAMLKIEPRELIQPSKRFVLDRWEDHLIDYLLAPPEVKKQTKIVLIGETQTHTTTDTERELKLSERGAIDLSEKMGIFDDTRNTEEDSHTTLDEAMRIENIEADTSDDTDDDLDNEMNEMTDDETDSD